MQFFISISTVKINIIICLGKQLLFYGPADTCRNTAIFFGRKFPVQIFPVLMDKAHGPVGKSADIDDGNNHQSSRNFFRFQLLCQFHCRLNSHVFCVVNSAGNQRYLSCPSAYYGHWKLITASFYSQPALFYLSGLYFQISNLHFCSLLYPLFSIHL